jgi:hypothetical protein
MNTSHTVNHIQVYTLAFVKIKDKVLHVFNALILSILLYALKYLIYSSVTVIKYFV